MFCAKILTPQEKKELKKIERVKKYDEERKARIFNARQRLIGVDIEALQNQIHEKKAREEARLAEEKAQYLKEVHNAANFNNIQRQIEKNKKILQDDINEFRRLHQKKEDRREFDLNDPNALRNSVPCRLADDNFLKFEGEEYSTNERKQILKEQQKQWLLQQIIEKRTVENKKKESDKLVLETIKVRDERAKVMNKLESDCRKQIEMELLAYNQALAYEQAMEKRMRHQMEIENNITEINNALTSDLLSENKEVAQSNLGLGKQIGSLYKGMSESEKREILKTQEQQRKELEAKREAEKAYDKYWVDFADRLNRNTHFLDLKNSQVKKQELDNMYEENKKLSKEQKARHEYLNKVVFTNTPTAAFYNQFNKTTR